MKHGVNEDSVYQMCRALLILKQFWRSYGQKITRVRFIKTRCTRSMSI